uniref:Uncharacterized protein n=1 Tax=Anguilla anguilla TaxID=7936 RepID=A0A0E9TJX9_ANGAN
MNPACVTVRIEV